MRYIELDHDAKEVVEVEDGKGGTREVAFTLKTILDEHCWGAAEWRQDEAWIAAWERLVPAFDEAFAKRLPLVGIGDKDHEKLAPMATMRGKQIVPLLARPITKLTACVLKASAKEPAAETSQAK
jgi:hypothetical protein